MNLGEDFFLPFQLQKVFSVLYIPLYAQNFEWPKGSQVSIWLLHAAFHVCMFAKLQFAARTATPVVQ